MPKGGGVIEGLWTGTAVYSALKARTFTGFLTSFLMFSVILIVGMAVIVWVLGLLGVGREKFSVSEIKCQAGEQPTDNCYGERGCIKPSGNCYKLLTTTA